ncbi:MAG: TonB-dependent receptor [Pseudomonadota bacterium]
MRILPFTACFLATLLSIETSYARDNEVETENDNWEVEKIIVTGTKKGLSLQDADIAATVLTSADLRNARVKNFTRLDDLVPNVKFNQAGPLGSVHISIRGVESNRFVVNRAAVYIDGIPFRELNNFVLTNIDSVEVLRGPQSTTYGANTESGLILINTRTPRDSLIVESTLTASQFDNGDEYQFEGYIGSEIIESKLSGSLALNLVEADYFIDNLGTSPEGQGDIQQQFLQGRLLFEPNDDLSINVTTYFADMDAPGVYSLDAIPIDVALYNAVYSDGILFNPNLPPSEFNILPYNGDVRLDDFSHINDTSKATELQEFVFGANAVYQLDDASLNISLSHRNDKGEEFGFDVDATNLVVGNGAERADTDVWSGEIRVNSQPFDRLTYIAGLSFYEENEVESLGTIFGPGLREDINYSPDQTINSQDYGAFFSGSYRFESVDKLTATFGLRYDRAKRETDQKEGLLDFGFVQFLFDEVSRQRTFNDWLPRFALRYESSDDLTFYTNVAKGYLPGGFNIAAAQEGLQEFVIEYDKETLWSYETGVKLNLPEYHAFIAGSLFFIETDNYQERTALTDDDGNIVSTGYIESGAATKSKGIEIEARWDALDNLQVLASFGFVDAEYTDYRDFSGAQLNNIIGNSVKLVPKYDANVSAQYTFDSGLFVRAEVNLVGNTPLDRGDRVASNINALDEQPAVQIYNVQLGYEWDEWTLRLFAENLTNERLLSGLAFAHPFGWNDGILYSSLDEPGKVGLEISYVY